SLPAPRPAPTRRAGGRPPARRAIPPRAGRCRAPHRHWPRWHVARRPRRGRAPSPPSPVWSQVEQPPGDDVALDLGAAAVNGGGAGVEELGPPALADRVVPEDHV